MLLSVRKRQEENKNQRRKRFVKSQVLNFCEKEECFAFPQARPKKKGGGSFGSVWFGLLATPLARA